MLEAGSALLTYMLLVPCAIPVRCGHQQFHYALGHSLEDVVLLSVLRAAAVVVAYLCGSARSCKQCVPLPSGLLPSMSNRCTHSCLSSECALSIVMHTCNQTRSPFTGHPFMR